MTRPRVTLKLATSLDGRIATATGESQWITGPESRQQGHVLRATHDAILVGIETVLADNPRLNVRLAASDADTRDPLRVVLDTSLRTPSTAHVATGHSLILTTAVPKPVGQAEVIRVAPDALGRPAIASVLDTLHQRGIASLLIEGGGRVAAAFVQAGVVDRMEWFRAPILLGADGRPGIAALDLANLASAPKYRRQGVQALGDDLWESYVRA
ncbi:RibD family protein [Brevundimonas vesicularis]|uniref:RibD family protein n=1 Tax=Brevundimonas vesicularis TaxID=41276 RepID=UPI0038D3E90B